jgi:hypothetical protein
MGLNVHPGLDLSEGYLLEEVTSDQEERALADLRTEGLKMQVSRWLELKAASHKLGGDRFQCAACGGYFPELSLRVKVLAFWWAKEDNVGNALQISGLHPMVVFACKGCYHRPHSVWMQEVRDGRYRDGSFRPAPPGRRHRAG